MESLGGEGAGEAMAQLGGALNAVNDVANMASGVLGGISAIGGMFGSVERVPEEGELQNTCITSADNVSGTYTDELGQYYEHTCLATKLMGTAAASLAVAYSLM